MGHWKDFYHDPNLSVADIDKWKEPIYTIRQITMRDAWSREEKKNLPAPFILWSEQNIKPMRMKKIDAKVLVELYGEDPDGWVGKKIQIYHHTESFFGKNNPQTVLRFRNKVPYDVHSQNSVKEHQEAQKPVVKEKPELNPAMVQWEQSINYLCSDNNKGLDELRKRFSITQKHEDMLKEGVMVYQAYNLPDNSN